ncbi:MAG: phenylalanine--tRNA ligase subunit beta [Acidobacteria bacterium]|nr:phenylalanine--tRNA ligase subunit beta [Acidobacteriota bacterium]MCB9398682.1 phenylalanine--tRNA ligase subunit beta [Acidobacteriota bacterium]
MYFSWPWLKSYIPQATDLVDVARLLNETGLETEVAGEGLEVEHTVNRPDAMNHFGLARELAVKTGWTLQAPPIFEGDIPVLEGWSITAANADECPRYMGVLFENVSAGPSPAWLVEQLTAIDQKSHNLLVDLTNFLLWEYGHPSHAFDADLIQGQTIHVRTGQSGERLTTLDGRDHAVENLLCICDAEKPIALGGVMGGENSEIGPNSRRLLLELGWFDPVKVRLSAKQCQIQSDAKHRFERGIDPENMDRIVRRFIYLLQREQPHARLIGMTDMNLKPFQRTQLTLRRARLQKMLGINLEDGEVQTLLARMDMQPEPVDQGWCVHIPGYKVDVQRECDVIEEVIRFAGLDRLASTLPAMSGSDFEPRPTAIRSQSLKSGLKQLGFKEIVTYGFQSLAAHQEWPDQVGSMPLSNPLSDNYAVMRISLAPNMLDCLAYNLKRGLSDLAFFELGASYRIEGERLHLALGSSGRSLQGWWPDPAIDPLLKVKGAVAALFRMNGWPEPHLVAEDHAFFRSGFAFGIYVQDGRLGWIGRPAQELLARRELEADMVVAELDVTACINLPATPEPLARLSPFPAIEIDMAFVVPQNVLYGEMKNHLIGLNLSQLEALSLFDVFEGSSLPKGQKSLGFRFRFRASDRSLTHQEVAVVMDSAVESVKQKFGAVIRS